MAGILKKCCLRKKIGAALRGKSGKKEKIKNTRLTLKCLTSHPQITQTTPLSLSRVTQALHAGTVLSLSRHSQASFSLSLSSLSQAPLSLSLCLSSITATYRRSSSSWVSLFSLSLTLTFYFSLLLLTIGCVIVDFCCWQWIVVLGFLFSCWFSWGFCGFFVGFAEKFHFWVPELISMEDFVGEEKKFGKWLSF